MPPLPGRGGAPGHRRGARRRRCTSTGWTARCPIGLGRDGEPIYLNPDFLDGTRGAHVSISGISGVATKTSFALFLLYSMFRSGVLGERRGQHQGADLQRQGRGPAVPRPPQHPARRRPARRRTRSSGLPAGAVRRRSGSTRRRAPATRPAARRHRPHQRRRPRSTGRSPSSAPSELLPYVFADAEDERNQYTMVIHQVAAHLRAGGRAGRRRRGVDRRPDRCAPTTTWSTSSSTSSPTTRPAATGPARSTGTGTVNAFLRRLRSSRQAAAPARSAATCPTPPAARVDHRESQQVTVVDLHNLPDRAQRFVVGVVLAAESERKEAAGHRRRCCSRARRAEQVRPARGRPARSRRCCSTSPSAAARWASS